MIENYLNKRYSLRNLSDQDFENLLPVLAQELEHVSYIPTHSDAKLSADWNNLKKWKSDTNTFNSTSRIGIKLCEHFFPNFYEIEMRNKTFKDFWKKENLEKILRWNRKSHSTPYLSELKRGVYFCCGLTKNTMYRPQMAKLICDTYKPETVLDPCAGWGGRMLGTVASGSHYIAFEPNTQTFRNLNKLVEFLGIEKSVTLICDDALEMKKYKLPKVDLVITSPPYYDLEIYCREKTQSIMNHSTYESWSAYFFQPLIESCISHLNNNGVSCWNVGKSSTDVMWADLEKYHNNLGYHKIHEFGIVSSKRQAINKTGSEKSQDTTAVFKA